MHITINFYCLLVLRLVCHVNADTTATVDPTSDWGTWEGWGTSLAWWAKAFGDRDDLADVFFTSKTTALNGNAMPGMMLNIVRYNAGAGSNRTFNGSSMVVSPKIFPSRQMDGFWVDGESQDPASPSWDWYADENQRNMLWKARDRGADIFELFSNSPMWWMCSNHNPSGANDGSNNLQSEYYQQHAVYLATVAAYAKANWGFSFQSIDGLNEPEGSWSGTEGTQEGCHFDSKTQETVIGFLANELKSRGIVDTIISAPDSSLFDSAVSTWSAYAEETRNKVGRINVHGYQGEGGSRDQLYNLAFGAGKRLWLSEHGDGDETGKSLVRDLLLDFTWLHPTAWVYWQTVDIPGWGLVVGDNDNKTLDAPIQKYFALAQFTRHIRPGMQILSSGSPNAVAAYDSANKKLVMVAANWDSPQYLNFDLSGFSGPGKDGSLVPRWTTKMGSGDQYTNSKDTYVRESKFWSWFDSDTIQTFEVSDVTL